jgi:hypothetical protein
MEKFFLVTGNLVKAYGLNILNSRSKPDSACDVWRTGLKFIRKIIIGRLLE